MQSWFEQLMCNLNEASQEKEIYGHIAAAARDLGFEYCAFGLQLPYPLTCKRVVMLNNYPQVWQENYQKKNYVSQDPSVIQGRKSTAPFLWDDALFAKSPEMWDEAQTFGLRRGWSQSSVDGSGTASLLTLARSNEKISPTELRINENRMRWLASVAHLTLSSVYQSGLRAQLEPNLTERELEVLRWSADGKSAALIADILTISKNTVDFHIKNAVQKLQTSNKTAAVARAVMLGLLF
jgi:DNA-binding CsgD family transcriptional regulator